MCALPFLIFIEISRDGVEIRIETGLVVLVDLDGLFPDVQPLLPGAPRRVIVGIGNPFESPESPRRP